MVVEEAACIDFSREILARTPGVYVVDEAQEKIFAGLPALKAHAVTPARRQEILREVEEVIAGERFRVIGRQNDQEVWQRGWGEVAKSMRVAARVDLETLKPQYFHRGTPFRLLGNFAVPATDYFEYYASIAVRRQLMAQTFTGCESLVEFGCGTGMNLILAADLFPKARLAGTDWVQAAIDILAIVGASLNRRVYGNLYNMLTGEGRDSIALDSGTDVLTVHALEQLGAKAAEVVDWLVAKRPRRCLHIEPIFDFYDRSKPFDDIAARYHLARGYLRGLLPSLKEYEARGRIRFLSQGRVLLGNLYHEAYSFIAWSPA
jgi:hypothetical protein